MAGELHDATKKLFLDRVKKWLEQRVKDPNSVNFALEQFSIAYDLTLAAVRAKGSISGSDIIKYFGQKGAAFAALSNENKHDCWAAAVNFVIAASEAEKLWGGAPGAVWYVGSVALEGIEVAGSCYLYYKDLQLERQLDEADEKAAARKIQIYTKMISKSPTTEELNLSFVEMLNWQARQPYRLPGIIATPANSRPDSSTPNGRLEKPLALAPLG